MGLYENTIFCLCRLQNAAIDRRALATVTFPHMENGLSQGDTCSPILFVVFVNNLKTSVYSIKDY